MDLKPHQIILPMDMDSSKMNYVFQTDSEIVNQYRMDNANYVIEVDNSASEKDLCIIYFTSNAVYYPNTREKFEDSIQNKDYYEWRKNVPKVASKQIFMRDIHKQWYLQGVNNQVNIPPRIVELLREATKGYRIITIGSSAGGYAAILYGCLLNAEKVFAFNPQWELNSLLESSCEAVNPTLFRLKADNSMRLYYDLIPFLNKTPIYYFVSEKSKWDAEQLAYLGSKDCVRVVRFKSSHHGIPFPRVALTPLLNLSSSKLDSLSGQSYNPLSFSIKVAGLRKTFTGVLAQILSILKKKI